MTNILEIEPKGQYGRKKVIQKGRYQNKIDIDSTLSVESTNTDIIGALGSRNSLKVGRKAKKPPLNIGSSI